MYLNLRNFYKITCPIVMGLMFSFGIIIGYFGKSSGSSEESKAEKLMKQLTQDQFMHEEDLIKETLENVSTEKLRSYLQELTREPHIAGHERDNELTEWIKNSWTEMGFDQVELATYDFYLTWPNAVSFQTL